MTVSLVLPIVLCLALEAFFAGSEVALVSVDRSRMRRRAEAGSAAARLVLTLLERPERLLSTTLTGTSLSVVAGSFLANELFARRLGPELSAWAILMMIPLILLFGEILPKTAARRHAEAVSLKVAFPLRATMFALAPAVILMSGAARLLTRPFRTRTGRLPFVTKEELKLILQADQRHALEREEASLIKRLIDFADTKASEPMTPLVDIASVSAAATVADAVRIIHERGFSRIPVYTERPDNITGLVEAMDLIDASPDATTLAPYVKKPLYVPETARIDRLLEEFRRHHQEMAVVVDEYGAAVGVLTLEDVVEQIVGDVLDEFDRPGRTGIEKRGEGVFLVDGRCKIDDLEAALGMPLPRAGYETVAGLTGHLFQKVPRAGESLEQAGLRFSVVDASQRTVRKVKIEKTALTSSRISPSR